MQRCIREGMLSIPHIDKTPFNHFFRKLTTSASTLTVPPTPHLLFNPISLNTHVIAMFVLPAPVGAQTSRFSFVPKAFGKIRDWIRLRVE